MDLDTMVVMDFGDARREKLRPNLKPNPDTCMDMDMAMVSMVDTMVDMDLGDARREKLKLNLLPNPATCTEDMALVSMVDTMATHMLDTMDMQAGDARREKLRPNLKLNPDTCMGTDMAMVSMVDTMADMVDMDLVTIGESNSLPSRLRCHQSAQFEPTMTSAFLSDLLFTCVQSYLIILYILCIVQHNNVL